jgi:hypothetical protein
MPLVTCADCGKQISDAAPSCIHCGRPLMHTPQAIAQLSRPTGEGPRLRCLRCGSDDLRSLSVVYASGLSTTQSSGRLTGIGIGEDGDVIFAGGGAAVPGVQQTALATTAAPPEPQTVSWLVPGFVGGVTALLVVLLGGWRLGALGAAVLALGVGFAIARLVYGRHRRAAKEYNDNVYRPRKMVWDQSVMCLRCGTIAQRPS